MVDLGAWVNEEYSVPGEQVTIPDEPETPMPPPGSAGED